MTTVVVDCDCGCGVEAVAAGDCRQRMGWIGGRHGWSRRLDRELIPAITIQITINCGNPSVGCGDNGDNGGKLNSPFTSALSHTVVQLDGVKTSPSGRFLCASSVLCIFTASICCCSSSFLFLFSGELRTSFGKLRIALLPLISNAAQS
ncbi:hypothetical protein M5K25_016901 [Dendrobium thyrsiflorum]|uniref:Uncharacterized protein n=1 Tax=Dendrobium thyrsiflorum TaxID=117978 RepID=A0ABD0UL26_DENTH